MRKILAGILTIIFIVMTSSQVDAASIDYSGGVMNASKYKEVIFVSGKPVVFEGVAKNIKVTTKESKGKITETISMKLTGPNNASLTRNYTYVSLAKNNTDTRQVTTSGEIKTYKETITINGEKYELTDFQSSQSALGVFTPATEYKEKDAILKKEYTVKKTKAKPERKITVDVYSKDEGYENFWGATQIQILESEYDFGDGKIWTVRNKVISEKSRTTTFDKSNARKSFIKGGYSVTSRSKMTSNYTYNMPEEDGRVNLSLDLLPKIQRLPVPKFRDISNIVAAESIGKLYALGILDEKKNYFGPNAKMTRYELTVAIGKLIDLRVLETQNSSKKALFKDVKTTRKDYSYLVSAYNEGIVVGLSATKFGPDQYISRQQAAAYIIRALDLENDAPAPGYKLKFKDSSKVFNVFKDGTYMATKLGFMTANSKNNFRPKEYLTRAEAAITLVRVLNYLEKDLKSAYKNDL